MVSSETMEIISKVVFWVLAINIFGFSTFMVFRSNRNIKDIGRIPIFRAQSALCCLFCTPFALCWPIDEKIPLVRQKHRPFPSWSATGAVILPLITFIITYCTVGYEFRYRYSNASMFLCALFFLLALIVAGISWGRWRRGKRAAAWIIIAVFLLLAVSSAVVLGDRNYWRYMRAYYDYQNLGIYVNVDPGAERGQTFMDAGEVYFKEGTVVAKENAVALRNRDVYCVAPIVRQPLETQGGAADVEEQGVFKIPDSGTVDFWAVGTNCCMNNGEQYKCGGVHNGMARSGLRVVRDDQRPFYKLAVDEWAAEYGIPVKHPLFFYWMQDPVHDVEEYRLTGNFRFYTQVLFWFVFNLVGAVTAHAIGVKYGA